MTKVTYVAEILAFPLHLTFLFLLFYTHILITFPPGPHPKPSIFLSITQQKAQNLMPIWKQKPFLIDKLQTPKPSRHDAKKKIGAKCEEIMFEDGEWTEK